MCPEGSKRPTVLDEFEYYESRCSKNYAKAVAEKSKQIDASLV